ncbi:glycoside hydrolase family 2 [Oerskovia sp. Sa1BUA8]|uniref:Glycoside hydrolase family 2 n=1 Tax=Oerskovia douganii TaxID=2762210 RepID=A0A9D5YYW8_9CELL|nr:glycoside hydrolase family 2 TIM barrel-domain containing protein [Oerskovia douganii]MBE7701123.1 glycoside hydrolase family 2 [Oerskovia douganii]
MSADLPSLPTRWTATLDRDAPLPEYPRPQLVRDSYLNLNGVWEHAFTAQGPGPVGSLGGPAPAVFDGEIVVPFSPESPLSGVGRQLQPDEALWYRRDLTLPEGFVPPGGRVLLHLGAVDQACRVLLDGVEVGRHVGGFLPFACDVTDALAGDPGATHELLVEVTDLSDTGYHARGKQKLDRGGIWYTAQSGIWQTVWVEAVPALHVGRLTLVPDLPGGCLEVTVHLGEGAAVAGGAVGQDAPVARIQVHDGAAIVAQVDTPVGVVARVPVPDARPWSPEDPHLYDVTVTLGDDEVRSYAGMRSFGVGPAAQGVPRLLLNGEPHFHVGVLDQGYWSDGLLTPPSDEAMVHDIATMKDLGFTMLRKHIKIEPLRWYHHCDRLGMLVWQDMVNGGDRYRPIVTVPHAVVPLWFSDRHHGLFSRKDPAGRAEFLREVDATVEHLRDVVSLAVWVPFNEGWGQFDAAEVAARVKALDPTRSVDHASGWHDQGAGNFRSLHVYFKPFRVPRRGRDRRALVLSEYGGYNLRVEGHSAGEKDFGYKTYADAEALGQAFEALHREQIVPAVARGLSATVYTQLSDVEDETNGLLTYDREVAKLPAGLVRAVNAELRLG